MIPVLPLPAMVAPAATAPANAMQVGWAALYARANNKATPALIQKWLRVGPEQAQVLMSELTKRQIIHAPIAGGATAVQPMYPNSGVAGSITRSRHFIRKAQSVVEDWVEDEDCAEGETVRPPEHEIEVIEDNAVSAN